MAALIVTDVTPRTKIEGSGLVVRVVDFTPSTSYPAGGEPVTAAQFGLTAIVAVVPVASTVANDLTATFNPATSKIVLQVISTAAESGAADQSAKTFRLLVIGTAL